MEPKDRKVLATCLLRAGELYGKKVSDAVADVWWQALEPYSTNAVESAFQRHFTSPDSGQFMPKPGDIVRMITGGSEDSALVAWAKVDKALRTKGTYVSVVFDDALIHRVLHDMGGWIHLGTRTDADWPFVGNEFVKRYRGYRSVQAMPEYPGRLAGICEASSPARLQERNAIAYIGDAQRAAQVEQGGTADPLIATTRVTPQLVAAATTMTKRGARIARASS